MKKFSKTWQNMSGYSSANRVEQIDREERAKPKLVVVPLKEVKRRIMERLAEEGKLRDTEG